ncbi:acyltransferase domain-containing protein [Streptomyces sp. HUAS MG91]|uniref:Acyltransferase domain-containing protein n=1 Tax=Streptomyces tabacisoli TaxID=3156398 RepID=A0AAU8IK23_9ACTN
MSSRIAFVFPGQGAYVPGLLAGFPEEYPDVAGMLREIDAVSAGHGHRRISELLLDPRAPRIEELLAGSPESLHLCIFALSLAGAAVCAAEGIHADVLVGHSFGEWAALTLAGVWTPAEAAHLICERDRVCRRTRPRPGGLLAVALGPRRAAHLAAVADDWAVNVAVVNGPGQSVLAGPDAALDDAARLADVLGVRAVRIKAAYPYHSPWMRAAGEEFEEIMHSARARTPRRRVYSPIAGGYVESAEDVRRIGSNHMVQPVDFLAALHALEADGVDWFVECGGKDIVTRLAAEVLPRAVTAAPLARRAGPPAARTALAAVTPSTAPEGNAETSADGGEAPGANVTGTGTGTSPATSGVAAAPAPAASASAPPVADFPPGAPNSPPGPAEAVAAPAPRSPSELESTAAPEGVQTAPAERGGHGADELPPRTELIEVLRATYAERLGYPPDVVTADADLEADLGVDSLRQTEMLTSVYARFGIRPPSEADPVRGQTLADIADLLLELAGGTPAEAS